MERPYVICYILSSLDGKITGPFMGTEAARTLGAEYGKYRTKINADAWLYGTATTKEFTGFRKPALEETAEMPEEDFVVNDSADLYFVSVDVDGEIGWESGTFCNKGRTPAHVIEILTASTPAAYKACLQKAGVSYIVAGEKRLDCDVAMKKLYELFHIEKLLICGGGIVNWSFLKACEADGFVFGSPVHYAGATGNMTAFMDRVFYSELGGNGNKAFYMKPAAAVVSARRAGTTVTFDQLNKYFTIQEMPVVSSRYWNMIHGANAEQARQDAEGLYTMRVLGRNMAYLLRCQEAARKAGVELPKQETPIFTNFIR